jgi:hypothetical protein
MCNGNVLNKTCSREWDTNYYKMANEKTMKGNIEELTDQSITPGTPVSSTNKTDRHDTTETC